MKKIIAPLFVAALAFGTWFSCQAANDAAAPKPLRVLLVAGGCCHDYATQTQLLKDGIESRINATVDVAYNPDTTTEATFEIYNSPEWADGFDVILHDECSANVTDKSYVSRIVDAHKKGKPAVNLHCAMHSYRWGEFKEPVAAGADNASWYEMIGIQSSAHGPKAPIDVKFTDADHPITKGLENWTTLDEELYNNIQVFPSAHALASGDQMQMPKAKKGEKAAPDAKGTKATAVVVWTNHFGPEKTPIFNTTLGHFNETVGDARYLDLVTRGLLWSVGHLNEDGTPAAGYAK